MSTLQHEIEKKKALSRKKKMMRNYFVIRIFFVNFLSFHLSLKKITISFRLLDYETLSKINPVKLQI